MLNAVSATRLYATLQGTLSQKATAVASPETISKSSSEKEQVSISSKGQAKLAAETSKKSAIAEKVIELKARLKANGFEAINNDEMLFLWQHDEGLSRIQNERKDGPLKISEIRYTKELWNNEEASQLIHGFEFLTLSERSLYDEIVKSGNQNAAEAMRKIGFYRFLSEKAEEKEGSGIVRLGNGRNFDPRITEITEESVDQLFRYVVLDEEGYNNRQFDALSHFLKKRTK